LTSIFLDKIINLLGYDFSFNLVICFLIALIFNLYDNIHVCVLVHVYIASVFMNHFNMPTSKLFYVQIKVLNCNCACSCITFFGIYIL